MSKIWSLLFGVSMAAAFGLFPYSYMKGWWLPKDVSTFGWSEDRLFYMILFVTGFFFVLTEAVQVWFMFKYDGANGGKTAGHDDLMSHQAEQKIEIAWSIVPGIILFLIAVVQIEAWADIKYQKNMPTVDETAQQMEVLARQWEWRIRYPSPERITEWKKSGKADLAKEFLARPQPDDVRLPNEVHVFKGGMTHPKKVLVHLRTHDVIHSFFLPHVRIKQDALPGKTIPVWFAVTEHNCIHTIRDPEEKDDEKQWKLASELSEEQRNTLTDPSYHRWEDGYDSATKQRKVSGQIWELACAEFCGSRHSMMRGKLYVHESEEDFMDWLRMAAAEGKRSQPAPVP